ncbi:DUF2637 domain-containing protein [Mycobacteroides abscessus]|uniref:Protein of uncharacterized function (DUF2637) n=1 Tax=Mycobacteroides abscessus TaxID=36809 RepID=A0AB33SZK3_9MYCO|nr:DUF2637 domain-containing protein [Mycobacteroides abscessus]CPT03939.1 Protein of uncharacterised function (DUF2637) [Mycobacteroides abscessus]CPT67950.1 Protein of uncharacterised function (DUF2637) [Mycobacteroides abscessus]CPT69188.1 Protein of uncharacterised function (DUF2637) [Mycobacteroides abscessus]CPV12699.1 Protein of uncharacterised function (DUF2637) [Mycobacteroides abscessus]CPV59518.1 Protein of uncharacterised function (DUF2637) [Mycobacteroides abscessus]
MNARRDFTAALYACTGVSLAGNEAAAVLLSHDLSLPTPVVMVAAAIAPLLLPGAVHLVPKTAGLPKRARRAVVGAVVISAAAAFALSFFALAAVAQGSGHPGKLGWLLPIAVDVLAAASAYALVVMPVEADARREAPTDIDAAQTPVHREASAPTQPADAPVLREAAPAPVATQTAPETDEPATRVATQELALRDADTEEIPLTSTASRDATPARRDAEAPTRRLTAVPPVRRDADGVASPATQTDPLRDAAADEPATQTASLRDADSDDAYLLRATQLVDAGRTKAPVAVVHRVLRGKATGVPNRELAEQVAISESAVQRIAKADRELAEASA